jgi:hypothetical protein
VDGRVSRGDRTETQVRVSARRSPGVQPSRLASKRLFQGPVDPCDGRRARHVPPLLDTAQGFDAHTCPPGEFPLRQPRTNTLTDDRAGDGSASVLYRGEVAVLAGSWKRMCLGERRQPRQPFVVFERNDRPLPLIQLHLRHPSHGLTLSSRLSIWVHLRSVSIGISDVDMCGKGRKALYPPRPASSPCGCRGSGRFGDRDALRCGFTARVLPAAAFTPTDPRAWGPSTLLRPIPGEPRARDARAPESGYPRPAPCPTSTAARPTAS